MTRSRNLEQQTNQGRHQRKSMGPKLLKLQDYRNCGIYKNVSNTLQIRVSQKRDSVTLSAPGCVTEYHFSSNKQSDNKQITAYASKRQNRNLKIATQYELRKALKNSSDLKNPLIFQTFVECTFTSHHHKKYQPRHTKR